MNTHLHQLIKNLSQRLEPTSSQPTQESWWLLEKLTGLSHKELICLPSFKLTHEQLHTLSEWIGERVETHKPLQYILGSVPFLDLTIMVQPPILIPRPETEELVDWLITQLKHVKNLPLSILDLCTGSGCIALALAKALPHATVIGSDINPQAINLACNNKALNGVENVQFMHSDLFEKLAHEKFDIIISNPPYLAESEWHTLEQTVKQWEDPQALWANNDGFALYETIIAQAHIFLRENSVLADHKLPRLIFEMGHAQAARLALLLTQAGYTHVVIHRDLSNKERWISVW